MIPLGINPQEQLKFIWKLLVAEEVPVAVIFHREEMVVGAEERVPEVYTLLNPYQVR